MAKLPSLIAHLVELAEEAVGLLRGLSSVRGTPASAEDLLTLAEVIKRLPIREGDARRWVRGHVAPRVLALGDRRVELYRWGDVVEALERPPQVAVTSPSSGGQAAAHHHRTSDGWQAARRVGV